jgi:hypothetical protein
VRVFVFVFVCCVLCVLCVCVWVRNHVGSPEG